MFRDLLFLAAIFALIGSCSQEEPAPVPTRNIQEHSRLDNFRLRQQHQFFKRDDKYNALIERELGLKLFGIHQASLKLDSMERHHLDSIEFKIQTDSFGEGTVHLKHGHLFTSKRRHTVTVISAEDNRYYTILSDKDTLLQFDYWWDNFSLDFITDINGDGYKDLMIQWFPSSGCCPRDIRNVYLYDQENNRFTEPFEFPNPVFYPREHEVRGMEYGHPGETNLYTYKWNRLTLDTIEYVFPKPDDSTHSTFIRTNARWLGDTTNVWSEIIKAPDTKYRELDSYNWFLGCYTD